MSELRADDPRQLGAYRLTRKLGQGGQGVVYLGESPQGTLVAVKLLHASLSGDPAARRRFLGEVEAVRKVAAFCTAQLLDADLDGDRPYLVSEYVDGPSLRELVIEEGPRQGGSLERLAIGTATALGAIHRAGVVHRDFKPGNVLLGIDGPRVIDFGVSRLMDTASTTTHLPMGTPAYMAPERMKGESAGPPADMWAWGLTVAYTATGRQAFTADTHQEVLARVLYGKPDLGSLSGRLREIVEACLAPEPGERPDAEGVLRLLLGQDVVEGDVLSTGAMAAVGGELGAGRSSGAGGGQVSGSGSIPGSGAVSGAGGRRSEGTGPLGAVVGLGAAESEPGEITDPDPTTSFPAITAPLIAARAEGKAREQRAAQARADAAAAGRDEGAAASGGGESAASAGGEMSVASSGGGGSVVSRGGGESAAAEDGADTTTRPEAVALTGRPEKTSPPGGGRRRFRPWQVVVVVGGLVAAVAGFLVWARGAEQGVEGTWTGSAEHFTAERVFPIELHLTSDDGGMMRWGADLHCSGRLGRTGSGMVFALEQVQGKECHPGTVWMSPTADPNQMAIKVTRGGKDDVTYSGKVARTS
ncbi:serine/threonine-protein kinase [Nonomuraea gerenzanensis]|uniref:Tyrosine protein kinase:Serine/threonine protein kinase n=1 Tax=Nonomuraea gerenzanensis TaxID=93944 RepID=A0A1M4E327_9ACTN|nr:serine/threonine-protein kinase [Nonomuraea gerenzanensis]UBU15435.1 serine/threonine protein kinase [Nonomuraea gerenzanensis]SBO93192.1 Tyrosine protein kinase:Serine/threonine protein kinase [Nonomuraea gerenzanensis]